MKGLSRWTSAHSEQENELGALIRYARSQGPTTDQIESLTACVLQRIETGTEISVSEQSGSVYGTSRPFLFTSKARYLACALLVSLGSIAWWTYFWKSRADHTNDISGILPVRAVTERAEPPVLPLTRKVSPAPISVAEALPVRVERSPAVSRHATASHRANPPAARIDAVAEVVLLQRARRVLEARPDEALHLVSTHETQYPEGLLREEREALAVEALQRSGRRDEALARFERLIKRYRFSAYRPRLESLLPQTR